MSAMKTRENKLDDYNMQRKATEWTRESTYDLNQLRSNLCDLYLILPSVLFTYKY